MSARNKCSHRLPGKMMDSSNMKTQHLAPTNFLCPALRMQRSKPLTNKVTHESSIFVSPCAGRCLVIHILSQQAAASQTTILSKQQHTNHTLKKFRQEMKTKEKQNLFPLDQQLQDSPPRRKMLPFTQTDSSCSTTTQITSPPPTSL